MKKIISTLIIICFGLISTGFAQISTFSGTSSSVAPVSSSTPSFQSAITTTSGSGFQSTTSTSSGSGIQSSSTTSSSGTSSLTNSDLSNTIKKKTLYISSSNPSYNRTPNYFYSTGRKSGGQSGSSSKGGSGATSANGLMNTSTIIAPASSGNTSTLFQNYNSPKQ